MSVLVRNRKNIMKKWSSSFSSAQCGCFYILVHFSKYGNAILLMHSKIGKAILIYTVSYSTKSIFVIWFLHFVSLPDKAHVISPSHPSTPWSLDDLSIITCTIISLFQNIELQASGLINRNVKICAIFNHFPYDYNSLPFWSKWKKLWFSTDHVKFFQLNRCNWYTVSYWHTHYCY